MRATTKGFSIIELMVAVLLGALLLMGLVQVYAGVRQSDLTQGALARVQESGRLAVEMITRDIRQADYWGCMRQRDPTTKILSITNRMDTTDTDYVAWTGANAVSGNNNITALTLGGKAVKAGTDVITLKTSTDLCAGQGRVVNPVTAGTLQVDASCPVTAGQPVVITTCDAGDLFTVSSVAAGVISHNTTYNTGAAVKNSSASLTKAYGAEAKILTPIQRIYFIATGTGGALSLFRLDDKKTTADELVTGVKDMQILYGEDTNNDNAPDKYRDASAVTNMDNVRSIRVTLTMISDVRVPNSPTGFLEKSITAVADIRNRSLK